jgi:hypothetical protein
LNDPDAIEPIDGDAADLTEDPIIWQRLGPEGINLELRKGGLCILCKGGGRSRESCRDNKQGMCNAFHHFLPFFPVSGLFDPQI